MGATLRELAKLAGVSVATASRAFNQPDKVEAATRERILGLAEEIDYRPNRAAQALSTGRNGSLGLVVPDLNNPFFSGIVKGAQAGVRAAGTSLLIADTDEDPSVELRLAEQLSQRTDAIILCSSRMSDEELERIRTLCPVVLVNRTHPSIPAVRFDSRRGVQEAAAHLRALGHHRVAYVAGPGHSFSNRARESSLAEEFPAQGLEVITVGHYEPNFDGGRRAADDVLVAGVSAVMVYNDVMALGLVGRLLAYGLRVPEDLSVIGWDNIEFAEMFTPPLTTVDMPREDAGRSAVEFLLARLAGAVADPPTLDTHLVFRRTTTRPPQTPRAPLAARSDPAPQDPAPQDPAPRTPLPRMAPSPADRPTLRLPATTPQAPVSPHGYPPCPQTAVADRIEITMERLGRAALSTRSAADTVILPPAGWAGQDVGIVHFGIGAFHRAHQAVFTQDAFAATGDDRWGICGVTQRSDAVRRQLAPRTGCTGCSNALSATPG
ncbi:substrate-binding domain-containing protein [Raineyella fluvialis]|uniref:substrate-binding domain-containing protein n=1 Tax=Raineyella fluvialis TaxID=2662261 RepID=UPI001EF112FF|nr:substrate-binding domain-containing protein [Raineyella fluvialis]